MQSIIRILFVFFAFPALASSAAFLKQTCQLTPTVGETFNVTVHFLDDTTVQAVANLTTNLPTNDHGDTPLTLILHSFEANPLEHSILLEWKTVSEINTDYFELERSQDGIIWEEISEIDGAGNSQSLINYEVMDENPIVGLSYYRIRITDINNNHIYSKMKKVNYEPNGGHSLFTYPNPAHSMVTITGYPSELDELSIYDPIGQDITATLEIIPQNRSSVTVDFTALSPGIYFLKTPNGTSTITKQ